MLVLGDPLANGRTSHLLPALLPFIRPFLPSLFLRPPLLASPFVFFSHPSRGRLSRGLARPITGCPPIHLFLPFSLFFSPFSLPPFFFPSSNLRGSRSRPPRFPSRAKSRRRILPSVFLFDFPSSSTCRFLASIPRLFGRRKFQVGDIRYSIEIVRVFLSVRSIYASMGYLYHGIG